MRRRVEIERGEMMGKFLILKRWWYSHRFSIIKASLFGGSAWVILEFVKWTTPSISKSELAIVIILLMLPVNLHLVMWEPEKGYCEYCGQKKPTELIQKPETKKILRLCKDCKIKG